MDAPADVNAANNDDIVFYLRDLSSSLVNSKKKILRLSLATKLSLCAVCLLLFLSMF